tara:strand:- start:1388 stop:1948 length:561 start_codon:yes stop_codon:yes gene_type:complete
MKIEELVRVTDPDVSWIRETLTSCGNKIGNVHFRKRSNGDLRKMCYRLHVKNPSVASAPKGLTVEELSADGLASDGYSVVSKPVVTKTQVCKCGSSTCKVGPFRTIERTEILPVKVAKKNIRKDVDIKNDQLVDIKNDQLTVYDVNKHVRKDGEIIGRGAWRCIPLENVIRISSNGKIYEIVNSKK